MNNKKNKIFISIFILILLLCSLIILESNKQYEYMDMSKQYVGNITTQYGDNGSCTFYNVFIIEAVKRKTNTNVTMYFANEHDIREDLIWNRGIIVKQKNRRIIEVSNEWGDKFSNTNFTGMLKKYENGDIGNEVLYM